MREEVGDDADGSAGCGVVDHVPRARVSDGDSAGAAATLVCDPLASALRIVTRRRPRVAISAAAKREGRSRVG